MVIWYQVSLFDTNNLLIDLWLIAGTLPVTSTPGQSGPGSHDN